MQGRNETCGCGSGLKYKLCCGRPKKVLTHNGMIKILQYLARTCEGEVFKIACFQLDSVPDAESLGVTYNVEEDCFELVSMVPPPEPLIKIAKRMP